MTDTTHADRVARSLKRLGFRLSRTGLTFSVLDNEGALAAGSQPSMTLTDIEEWVGQHIKPKGKRG